MIFPENQRCWLVKSWSIATTQSTECWDHNILAFGRWVILTVPTSGSTIPSSGTSMKLISGRRWLSSMRRVRLYLLHLLRELSFNVIKDSWMHIILNWHWNMGPTYILTPLSSRSGQSGFRNTRDGGETIHTDKSGPHLVYLVYRSFKYPPK